MAAQYPSSVRSFTNKVDLIDTIYADHVNVLQDEVRAVETTLGTGVLTSSYTGTFSSTYNWTNLSDRLANIEAGLVTGITGTTTYFRKSGDTIIASVGTVGLLVQPSSGSSADVLQTKTSSNSLGFRVDYLAVPYVGNNAVLYVGSTAYNTLVTNIATAQSTANAATAAASSAGFSPFLLGGM